MTKRKKYLAKKMRAYILVCRVFYEETWFHDLGELAVSYHSDTPFEQLDDRYTTECRIGTNFFNWCIVKLYLHVPLCITFHMLIVYNDIIHLGIKVIPGSG